MEKVSVHESINRMYEKAKKEGISTVFDRWLLQQPQCGFGLQGICCQLCSHGPCRITKKAQAGICGANADTIVARNWLRLAIHGASSYSHHLEEAAKTLKVAALGNTIFQIREEKKLEDLATALEIGGAHNSRELAIKVADGLLQEIRKGSDEPFKLTLHYAPKPRIEVWERLGILGGGINSEIRDNMSRVSTSIDTDPVDLLLKALRLSVTANYVCLAIETIHDILFGSPSLKKIEADLGIIDPDYVNIVAHGHQPFMAYAVMEVAKSEEFEKALKEAEAKGIKVYGSMCTGQELAQREAPENVYGGQLGNWIFQEFWLATGAIDAVMMDMNCSIPSLSSIAKKYHTKLIPVSSLVRLEGADTPIEFKPELAKERAKEIITSAIEAFKNRKKNPITFSEAKSEAITGTGIESVLKVLGGSLDPLIGAIKDGKIRGIAAVVGCTTTKTGHDELTVRLTEELISRNVLVVNAGCASSAVEARGLLLPEAKKNAGDGLKAICEALGIPPCLSFGTCTDISRIALAVTAIANTLGADVPALPVAASAPEYLEQKAVLYGTFALAFGLFLHVSPLPPVIGSSLVTKILTENVEALTGGKVAPESDPKKGADLILNHIESKRKLLGLS
ncbi:MAG: anaerobic carbon-monoxide dehydrogenase catalytic subunit [Deltaproteobacteria bacterium]|nr:anaerobic carbon-monoxide dehydrogenase catalytic subunit [Deltaproteobacteria bacterium]